MIKKLDKKSLKYLGIVFAIAVLVWGGVSYYSRMLEIEEKPEEKKPTEKSLEEIIESLSASEPGEPILEELQESLSASDGFEPSEDTENILKSLTAPE